MRKGSYLPSCLLFALSMMLVGSEQCFADAGQIDVSSSAHDRIDLREYWDNEITPENTGDFLRLLHAMAGDLNADGVINNKDLNILLGRLGEAAPEGEAEYWWILGDLNMDGRVDHLDVEILTLRLGTDTDFIDLAATAMLRRIGVLDPHGLVAFDEGDGEGVDWQGGERSLASHSQAISITWDNNDHNSTISHNYWPNNHRYTVSSEVPTPPNSHTQAWTWANPNSHSKSVSQNMPPNHYSTVSAQWTDNGHSLTVSSQSQWPSNHYYIASSTWTEAPDGHDQSQSRLWPPSHAYSLSVNQVPPPHLTSISETWNQQHGHGMEISNETGVWPPAHTLVTSSQRWPNNHITLISYGWPTEGQHAFQHSIMWPPNHYADASLTWPSPNTPWPPGHFFIWSSEDGIPGPPPHNAYQSAKDFRDELRDWIEVVPLPLTTPQQPLDEIHPHAVHE